MPQNPWLVPITTLRRSPGTRREETRSGRLDGLVVAGSSVPSDADIEIRATLDSVDGGIEVTAKVVAPWRGECRRCLKDVSGRLEADVRELYRPHAAKGAAKGAAKSTVKGAAKGAVSHAGGHPGRSEGEEDEETYPLEGELLDLRPLARDAVLLELPLAPLCSEGCRGLCPTCGADLNSGPCGCDVTAKDPRWAALDALQGPGGRAAEGPPGAGAG